MMPVILAVHFPAKKLAKLRMSAMQLGAKVRIVEKCSLPMTFLIM